MKQNAYERVMQMHKSQNELPFPDFVKIPQRETANSSTIKTEAPPVMPPKPDTKPSGRLGSVLKYINLPEMLKNSDSLLLLGLILLLSSDSADETLILALAYIML